MQSVCRVDHKQEGMIVVDDRKEKEEEEEKESR